MMEQNDERYYSISTLLNHFITNGILLTIFLITWLDIEESRLNGIETQHNNDWRAFVLYFISFWVFYKHVM